MKTSKSVRQSKKNVAEPCAATSTHDDDWVCVRPKGHAGKHESERVKGGTLAVWSLMPDGSERGETSRVSSTGRVNSPTGGWASPASCGALARHGAPCVLDAHHAERGERHSNGKFTWALRGKESASLADACDKCGVELGEHEGSKCPPKVPADRLEHVLSIIAQVPPGVEASSLAPVHRTALRQLEREGRIVYSRGRWFTKFVGETATQAGAVATPTPIVVPRAGTGDRVLGYRVHAAAALYPMLEPAQLGELADDIRINGLRDDIELVRVEGEDWLLDGRNRAAACELANVKPRFRKYDGKRDIGTLVDYVVSKNSHRRHLTITVRAMIAARAERLRPGNPGNRETGRSAGLKTQAERAAQQQVSERIVRKAESVIAKMTPKVEEAIMKGKLALEGAEVLVKLPPAKQNEIAERALAKSGEVKSGFIRSLVKQEEKRATIRKINTGRVLPLSDGPFGVIYGDYPWPYDNSDQHEGSRGHMDYPPMPMDEILAHAREVVKRAAGDCVLALWVTNAFIHEIGRVEEAYGATHHTMWTWDKATKNDKDKKGVGTWGRGRTEHLVIASIGKPVHTLNEVDTLIRAAVREHSRKPDEVRDLLAKHCAGPHLELFGRQQRERWEVWGAEVGKFADEAKKAKAA